jgi:serine/threonine-protein kinase
MAIASRATQSTEIDGRTDIYAASVMFYRALTGVLPYNAESLNELLFKIVLEDPKPLRELAPEVDEVFAAMVHKGLARELPQRFPTARAFQDEIVAWGKTQGRSSLSFAVTHASDRPPHTSDSHRRSVTDRAAAGRENAPGGPAPQRENGSYACLDANASE